MIDALKADIAAESLLIGSVLHENEVFDDVAGIVSEKMFSTDLHKKIWSAICKMLERDRPVDIFTLGDEIKKLYQHDETPYLVELMQNAYYTKNAKAYAKHVKDLHTERALKAACVAVEAISNSNEYQTIDDKLEAAQNAIMAVSDNSDANDEPKALKNIMAVMVEDIERRFQSGSDFEGLKTGFCDLDALAKGLKPGNLVIVCGRPGSGKTTLAMNIASHIADKNNADGGPVLFCSLEMGVSEIGHRAMLSTRMTDSDDIERPSHRDEQVFDRIGAAMSRCTEISLHVHESADTVAKVASLSRTVKRKHGLAAVVVDYIGLMRAEAENRVNEISEITRGLKRLAMQLGVPIIALAQLNRKCEDRSDRRPQLADLRDSGSIEQDANIVIGCYRDSYYTQDKNTEGFAEISVLKNRQGRTGTVIVGFDGPRFLFYSLDEQSQHQYRMMIERQNAPAKRKRGLDDD